MGVGHPVAIMLVWCRLAEGPRRAKERRLAAWRVLAERRLLKMGRRAAAGSPLYSGSHPA